MGNSHPQVEEFKVERAQRSQVKLRMALQGPSNSGKTATALLLAMGIVQGLRARGKLPTHLDDCFIGLLDTENDSASLYDHLGPFDRVVLGAPYTVDRYLGALQALLDVGYPVIIIDQISHEWTGPGGILYQVSRSKEINDMAKWNGPSQAHDLFLETLLHCPAHLIVTMRAKTAYVLEKKVGKDGRERNVPTRIGMAPQQRAGSEYEFTTLMDLTVDHSDAGKNAATCLKDRTQIFVGGETIPRLGLAHGFALMDWVYSAKKELPAEAEPLPEVRALALCEAGLRAVEQAANLPELERTFLAEQKVLRDFVRTAGRDVIVPLLDRLNVAKDARKACFVVVPGHKPSGLVSDLDPSEVARPAREPEQPDAVGVATGIVNKLQRKADASGLFSGLADDLPWQDEPPADAEVSQ